MAQDQPGALYRFAAGPARHRGGDPIDPVGTGAAGLGPPRRVLHDGRPRRQAATQNDRQLRLPLRPRHADLFRPGRGFGRPVRHREAAHVADQCAARLHRGVLGPGLGAADQYRGAADPVRARGESRHRDRLAGPLHANPHGLPRSADGLDRRGAQHHRGEQPHRIAADPVAVAGARAATDQSGAGRKSPPAVGSEQRSGAQEPRGGAGQTGAGRKSHAACPVVEIQIRVPGEHVARVAHTAEQLADSGPAVGRQSERQPVEQPGGVCENHSRFRLRLADPD